MRSTVARSARLRGEVGGIVTGWLVRLIAIMAVLGVVGYEVVTTAFNAVTIEDAAQEVARSARRAYQERDHRLEEARAAAAHEAGSQGVELLDTRVEGSQISVTVRDQADTLFVHRITQLNGLTIRTATSTVTWQ